ncbi:MAG: CGNR zinc finger domain-containing protein [Pseudonocardiaceae bacterium]
MIYHKMVSADQTGGQSGGGSPLLGEPLAIEFANTHYAVRGRFREGIGTPAHLAAWLRDNAAIPGPNRPVDAAEVETFRALRVAIRGLCQACVDARPGDDKDVEVLNAAAASAPRWPQLHCAGGAYTVSEHTQGNGTDAALAAIARDAIAILGGPSRIQIRACQAPGCVLFFVKDHPRRHWCSAGCGNRVRAARHYQRHRTPAP